MGFADIQLLGARRQEADRCLSKRILLIGFLDGLQRILFTGKRRVMDRSCNQGMRQVLFGNDSNKCLSLKQIKH